jgi:hypothetical protein
LRGLARLIDSIPLPFTDIVVAACPRHLASRPLGDVFPRRRTSSGRMMTWPPRAQFELRART